MTLLPDVVRVLRDMPRPAVPRPDDFVFTTPQGQPIDLDRFVEQHWHRALSATGIRPRKLYATRHTFISAALTKGANLKWLADYTGTSVDADQLALLGAEVGTRSSLPPAPARNRDPVPISGVKPGKSGPSRVRGQARKNATKH